MVAAVLFFLVALGGVARMVELWPQSYGITRFPYDDEGVYAGAAQLFLQGAIPYRDYFFAHPPIAAISYAPAMLYHFTEWGSPTSFMMARYLSVFYSLVTLALIFLVAYRLAGLWGGLISGLLWAVDGRVVEINRKIMLEGPLVLLSCGAILLYLWARPALQSESLDRAPRRPLLILGLAGAVAALSALTKIAGLACLLAILADMVWLRFENRRASGFACISGTAFWPPAGCLSLGVLVAVLVVLGPFLLARAIQFVREVIFFQMLRPSDGVIDTPARIADITSTLGNALTPPGRRSASRPSPLDVAPPRSGPLAHRHPLDPLQPPPLYLQPLFLPALLHPACRPPLYARRGRQPPLDGRQRRDDRISPPDGRPKYPAL